MYFDSEEVDSIGNLSQCKYKHILISLLTQGQLGADKF